MESANRGFSSYEPASEMKKIRQPLNKLLEGTEILLLKQPSSSQKVKTVRSRSTANFQRPTTTIAGWARQRTSSPGERPQTSLPRYQTSKDKFMVTDTRQEKKKIKQTLGKIELLRTSSEFCTGNPLEIIFDLLSSLAKTQNFYQGAFEYISQKLKYETIFNRDNFQIDPMKVIIQKTNNPQLVKSIYSKQTIVCSYRDVCKQLAEEFAKFIRMYDEEKDKFGQYIGELNTTVEEKRQTIRKMKDTVKYYSFHPSQDLYPYIEELEKKLQENKQLEIELRKQKAQALTNLQIMKNANNMISDKLEESKAKIYELEIAQFSGMKNVESNSELTDFEKHVESLKAMLDKSLIRMVGMKEQFDRLRQQNESLVNERSELAKRAAVGFSELTPRPNLKKIFEEQGMQFNKIFKNADKKVSTEGFVKTIVAKFRDTFKSFKELELNKRIVYDTKGSPLNKVKQAKIDEPFELLQQLKKNKEKLKQTQQAAFNVKNKYNKQLEQKRKLQAQNQKQN